MFKKAMQNMHKYLAGDLSAMQSYGIDPPKGPIFGNTEPRFNQNPTVQQTRSGRMNSRMGPNTQAGREFYPDTSGPTKTQKYDLDSERFTGQPSPNDEALYIDDDRVPPTDISGKNNYQKNPAKGDPANTRPTVSMGYPVVPWSGAESFFDNRPSIVDRDPGEVNSAVVYPHQTYRASRTEHDIGLGDSNFGPVESQYPSERAQESFDSHKDETPWVQTHHNAVMHTTGHDHPYGHVHRTPLQVTYSASVGNEGTDYLPTVGGGPIGVTPYVPGNFDPITARQILSHYD